RINKSFPLGGRGSCRAAAFNTATPAGQEARPAIPSETMQSCGVCFSAPSLFGVLNHTVLACFGFALAWHAGAPGLTGRVPFPPNASATPLIAAPVLPAAQNPVSADCAPASASAHMPPSVFDC